MSECVSARLLYFMTGHWPVTNVSDLAQPCAVNKCILETVWSVGARSLQRVPVSH